MFKWLKKLFIKKPQKKVDSRSLMFIDFDPDKDDQFAKELLLLEDPICGKHHG